MPLTGTRSILVNTIGKFYLHDAVTPNSGTMPSAAIGTTGDAPGATTARDATDTIGVANPDIESTVTATANQNAQNWGHRRFVSRPLAAQTISLGTWTLSYARSESNTSHNQSVRCTIYTWRPSTGLLVTTVVAANVIVGAEPTSANSEQAESVSGSGSSAVVQNGDILVFDIYTSFTQSMSSAYTETFAYDGDTEGSTTSCASFVQAPNPITLAGGTNPGPAPFVSQAVKRSVYYMLGGLWKPEKKRVIMPREALLVA